MKNYCIDILEQMGLHVLNPNQEELCIVDKSTNESFIKGDQIRDGKSYINKDCKEGNFKTIYFYNDGTVNINENHLQIRLDGDKDNYHGHDVKCATYNVEFGTGEYTIKVLVRQFNERSFDSVVGDTLIWITNTGTHERLGRIWIDLYSDRCVIDSNRSNEKEIPIKDCNTGNIMNFLVGVLNNCPEVNNTKELQYGLKYIIPSLTKAVNDLLEFWKDYAIPKEIRDREMKINIYKDNMEYINNQINSEAQSINRLNEILNGFEKEETKGK